MQPLATSTVAFSQALVRRSVGEGNSVAELQRKLQRIALQRSQNSLAAFQQRLLQQSSNGRRIDVRA